MIIMFLLACTATSETGDLAMPVEVVSCTHPYSRFEAVVQVEIEDEIAWSNIHFEISQADLVWETKLQTEDQLYWWATMQLIELDCYDNLEYEVIYE
jgi:hypothetical protein